MVFNQIYLNEIYNISLSDKVLIKLEDSIRKKDNVVVTIDASHYAFLNKNNTIYRHDTVRDCIHTFVYPDTKPIIENHMPKLSDKFGRVIAADYKETAYYNSLINKGISLENLTTKQYMELCKEVIIPLQGSDHNYNGLAYCQLVGKIDHKDGIQKIMDSEFLYVSIGAKPNKLICSECGQDQVKKICDHYPKKGNGIFMLAEDVDYEELSFVPKPADKFGKITFIHDGEEVTCEAEPVTIKADVDIILARDFFKQAEGKKIVCMDNICKVINEPEDKMRKQKEGQKTLNVSYIDEFNADQLKDIKLTDSEDVNVEESLKLSDEVMGELTNRDFAIVQKTEDGIKRRFPIHNAENVKAGVQLIGKAEDLTESEKEKAITSIGRAAKKLGIEFKIEDGETTEEGTEVEDPTESVNVLADALETIKAEIEKVEFEEKEDGTVELKDASATNPINEVFNMLISFAGNLRWAGEALHNRVTDFLIGCGKEACEKGMFDSIQEEVKRLKDSIAERDEEIAILEEQNMELNHTIRVALVDEIVSFREELKIADSDKDAEKAALMKLPYDALLKQKSDFSKLRAQITTTPFNNTTEITTIDNPTLNDSDAGSDDGDKTDDTNLNDSDSTPEVLTDKEIVKAFINLFRNV